MSSPSVGSSSTRSSASMAVMIERWSCVTMPFESSRTFACRGIFVRSSIASARDLENRGCTAVTKSRSCDTRIQRGRTATSAMYEIRCMSLRRSRNGSSPRTVSSPSQPVRPSTALRRVVLPAPLGPMRPTIRPGPISKETSSTARSLPKRLVTLRARTRLVIAVSAARTLPIRGVEELAGIEPEPLDGRQDLRPFLLDEAVALELQELPARSLGHEHAATTPLLDQPFLDQLLVALEHRERVQAVLGRHVAHGRERVTVGQHAFENHGDDAVAELPVDRQVLAPFGVHVLSLSRVARRQ